jgi:hypothetical protein
MSEHELERVLGKLCKLRELQRAKEHVKQLERELRGEPVRAQESERIPEYLRPRAPDAAAN